jgi:hypothetical protein
LPDWSSPLLPPSSLLLQNQPPPPNWRLTLEAASSPFVAFVEVFVFIEGSVFFTPVSYLSELSESSSLLKSCFALVFDGNDFGL